jgi:DNA-binding winged helix-turn-helix (wHTH) protein
MSAEAVPMYSPEYQHLSNATPIPASRYLRFGMFHLDLRKEELFKGGTRVKLQGKVYQALLALLEKPGEVVTREALRARLWPSDTHVNYDANVNTTVNKLRQALGDSPNQPVYVNTIPRRGYCFVAKIEYSDHPAPRQMPQLLHKPEAHSLAAAEKDQREPKTSFLGVAVSSKWFTAGVISLVVASMLFGAALVLYARR